MEYGNQEQGVGWGWLKSFPEKSWRKLLEGGSKIKKLGQDDPRRVVHSVKVGLAITLVSLFYYFEPLYDGFGVSAMWAVLTVVVVFEFSVGATLGRGLNRGLATLAAGALGVTAHHLACLSGEKGEPILLSFFIFLIATSATFLRFSPRLKARYDYGLIIFILTFCLISVSGYRDEEVLEMAHKRLSTILIGGSTALIVCIFICPVWAGHDLHNLVATNLEKLGNSLEAFGSEYFHASVEGEAKNRNKVLQEYRSVLNSKGTEEALVNFARWEPRHGQFKFRHPWKQYPKIGSLTRHCAYRIEALNSYLNADIQASIDIRGKIKGSCTKMSSESGKAMKELAAAIKTMSQPSTASTHIANSKEAAKSLECLLRKGLWENPDKSLECLLRKGLWENPDLLGVVPIATVALLLIDIVSCTDKIAESVRELVSLAQFKTVRADQRPGLLSLGRITPRTNSDRSPLYLAVTIEG